jgi:hypothetical protein
MFISSARWEDDEWKVTVNLPGTIHRNMQYHTFLFDEDLKPKSAYNEKVIKLVRKERLPIITGTYPEHTDLHKMTRFGMGKVVYRFGNNGWYKLFEV